MRERRTYLGGAQRVSFLATFSLCSEFCLISEWCICSFQAIRSPQMAAIVQQQLALESEGEYH